MKVLSIIFYITINTCFEI